MLYIRTDANRQTAAGHVMRCLAIACELRKLGEETVFLITEKAAADIINQYGFKYIILHGEWNNLEKEIEEVIELIKALKITKLLVDSYHVTNRYFQMLSKYVKLIYLGSLEQAFPGISLLINYSNALDLEFYSKMYGKETKLLLGVGYAPLRKEFSGLKPRVNNHVKNILITTGSSDNDNITQRLVNDLLPCFLENKLHYHLVTGSLNDYKNSLAVLEKQNSNITIHSNVADMAKMMQSCDVAVSASGTTLYELCACGVPTVCFAITNEQVKNGEKFGQDGIMFYCGNIADDYEKSLQQVNEKLQIIIDNYTLRKEMACKMNKYIDGSGCSRIADEIMML